MSRGDRAAVFLDRDGVLVRARVVDGLPKSIRDIDELELEEGAEAACSALRSAGFVLVVVTNQPEVARGTLTLAAVARINTRLKEILELDDVVVCPHDDADGCTCRKPLPGMLHDSAARHEIDLATSFMVGDRWRDIEAGRRAGCTSIFLNREYSEKVSARPDFTVRDVGEAADLIMARPKS